MFENMFIPDGPVANATVSGAGIRCSLISQEDYDCSTILGVNITIMCAVIDANPPATLRATIPKQNNAQVDTEENRLQITINDLTMENLGVYQCIASNRVGRFIVSHFVYIQISLLSKCGSLCRRS